MFNLLDAIRLARCMKFGLESASDLSETLESAFFIVLPSMVACILDPRVTHVELKLDLALSSNKQEQEVSCEPLCLVTYVCLLFDAYSWEENVRSRLHQAVTFQC